MAAYVVMIRDKLRDEAAFARYADLAPKVASATLPIVRAFYGDHVDLEGPDVDGVVILEFATIAEAEAWYRSEDYTQARVFRHLAADYRVIICEGVDAAR